MPTSLRSTKKRLGGDARLASEFHRRLSRDSLCAGSVSATLRPEEDPGELYSHVAGAIDDPDSGLFQEPPSLLGRRSGDQEQAGSLW